MSSGQVFAAVDVNSTMANAELVAAENGKCSLFLLYAAVDCLPLGTPAQLNFGGPTTSAMYSGDLTDHTEFFGGT